MQRSLLSYVNEHRSLLSEQWYSLTQRLEAIAHYNDETESIHALTKLFHEYGITLHALPGYPFLYGERFIGAPFTLLLWSDGSTDAATTHQWHILAMRLLACQLYREAFGLSVNLKWLIDTGRGRQSDQAVSSNFSEAIDRCLQADGCLYDIAIPALFSAFAVGTKGLLRVALEVETHPQTHAIYGSTHLDAAWRLTWALNALKSIGEEVLIEGFYDTVAPPTDDEIDLLRHSSYIQQDGFTLLPGLRELQARYAAQFVPTCNIIHMKTDTAPIKEYTEDITSLLSTRAHTLLDFYLVSRQQPQDIYSKLQQHLVSSQLQDVRTQLLSDIPPIHTSLHHPFVQVNRAAINVTNDDRSLDKQPLMLIPYATESICRAPLKPLANVPTIFVQFGPSEAHNTASYPALKSLEPVMIAHLTHFIVLLEELHHADYTNR